jgi:hypothetical protein
MADSKRKLRNTTDGHHSSPQKHRRISQDKEQHTPPPEPQSPSQSQEQQVEAQDKHDQLQGVVSDESRTDTEAATVPSQSQPDQNGYQESKEGSQTTSASKQKESNDNATSRESSATPQTPLREGDSIKEISLDGREGGEQSDGSRTKLNPSEDAINAEGNWDDHHRRKRARTNDKAEGDGIQDDDEDSAPEEDEENQVVPEYVLREMQAFEQGFNGLQGKFKLLDKIGAGIWIMKRNGSRGT